MDCFGGSFVMSILDGHLLESFLMSWLDKVRFHGNR